MYVVNISDISRPIDEELDYDIDEVTDYCKSPLTSQVFSDSVQDLNSLVTALTSCQQSFHSISTNNITQIYEGFATAVGSTSENSGVTEIINYAAELFNTCYKEAETDQQILDGYYLDSSGNQNIESDSSSSDNSKNIDQTSGLEYNEDGTLKGTYIDDSNPGLAAGSEERSQAQSVVNDLLGIPGHANGTHSSDLDSKIDNLSNEQCVWVLSRIENKGFGQTGAGYSNQATAESHQNFVQQQVNERYGGDIHNLLKSWGTYSYSGY